MYKIVYIKHTSSYNFVNLFIFIVISLSHIKLFVFIWFCIFNSFLFEYSFNIYIHWGVFCTFVNFVFVDRMNLKFEIKICIQWQNFTYLSSFYFRALLIFAPLIFAHPKNYTFRALLIFAQPIIFKYFCQIKWLFVWSN